MSVVKKKQAAKKKDGKKAFQQLLCCLYSIMFNKHINIQQLGAETVYGNKLS